MRRTAKGHVVTARTDEQRVLSGVPVEVEHGATPGAVAKLRVELRQQAANLPRLAKLIAEHERQLLATRSELDVYRWGCDELMDAIERLGGETS